MSGLRDRLAPILAGLLVVVVAIGVVLLLRLAGLPMAVQEAPAVLEGSMIPGQTGPWARRP